MSTSKVIVKELVGWALPTKKGISLLSVGSAHPTNLKEMGNHSVKIWKIIILLISDHPLPRSHSRVLFADEILKPPMYIFSIQVGTLEAHEALDVVYVLGAIK
ncbi:MAG: hypothetical protein KAU38_01450 [Desulfobacterales bacterium]|nr:hypothetical protein [Desulfobacterales bacterium]